TKTVVSNDSVGIMRMLATAFDAFLDPGLREVGKPGGGLRPLGRAAEIDELGARIEAAVNWGTYKCGMAASQADYDECMKRLFTIAVRFDMAYYTIFMCNWKMIRSHYPNLHRWLRALYYEVDDEAKGAFKSTTHFEIFMEGYARSAMRMTLVPWGPAVPIMPLDT
ncbi:Glutathione S-transferase omega-like, partial [Lachnellula subtilissima]